MKRIGQCASRKGGIMKDKVLMAGQTAGQIVRRERLMVDKELSPAQKKHMDRNNDGSISGADFAMMDNKFDFKSTKNKNKRSWTTDLHGERDFSEHNTSTRRTEGTINEQRKLRENNKTAMDKDMGGKTLYKKYCKKGRK